MCGGINVYTDTEININGQNTKLPDYANMYGNIYFTIDITNDSVKDENGNYHNYKFTEFEKKPNINSFKMKLTSLDGVEEKTNISAVNFSMISDTKYSYKFRASDLYIFNDNVRHNVEIYYNTLEDFYYNEDNKADYASELNSYFSMNHLEYENTKEEVFLAYEINSHSNFNNLKNDIISKQVNRKKLDSKRQ